MKLLVADDSAVYRKMLGDLLVGWGYDVQFANDGIEALAKLQAEDRPRLAIIDGTMPGLSGPELCKAVRATSPLYIYLVLLSANDQEADVAHGFELGADDYLCKPLKRFDLYSRLRVGMRIIEMQNALLASQQRLQFEATHDALTRLWNRAGIMELLRKDLSRASRLGDPLTVCLSDLDFFKKINDTYGHLAGDQVLRVAGERMANSLRPYDSVGRYGGEEFLVVLPGCTAQATLQIGERLRKALSEQPIFSAGNIIQATMSLGVCEWQSGMELNDLLHYADLALYRAKELGRNRVELFEYQPSLSHNILTAGENFI